MATTITELPTIYSGDDSLPAAWCIQVNSDNASGGQVIKAAETSKKHWIERLIITPDTNEWFAIRDGENNLIGPIIVAAGVPWKYVFLREIHGTVNTALNLVTQDDSKIHMIIEGHTDVYLGQASNPSPANEATGVGLSAVLSWSSSPQAVSHNVYFGTSSPPSLIGSQVENTYDPDLSAGNTYYWRIDESDGENVVEGDVWTFST